MSALLQSLGVRASITGRDLKEDFRLAVSHFRLSPDVAATAWDSAMIDQHKAAECYAAIARSLAA